MKREITRGLIAGAAGTVALNVTTNLDMVIRGRPASSVPETVAGKAAAMLGVRLKSANDPEDKEANRKSGLGALMGYDVGLGIGILYGIYRSRVRRVRWPLAGIVLGVIAMLGSDLPATASGVTNPKSWSLNSWLSDIIPHAIYGLVTANAYDQCSRR